MRQLSLLCMTACRDSSENIDASSSRIVCRKYVASSTVNLRRDQFETWIGKLQDSVAGSVWMGITAAKPIETGVGTVSVIICQHQPMQGCVD
jgi:hypothetical protein